jgi:HD-GYP domain-containing protein (c-di-GMP phosphodiesterase class II)
LSSVAELIHAHHEHWDGKGYPEGLKGEMIPKGARIIAVVNAFDSISSDQPYRAARSFEYAVREITEGSGTQFDPQVVEAFLRVPQSTWRDQCKPEMSPAFRKEESHEQPREHFIFPAI